MAGLLDSLPVVISIIISSFIPFSVLPGFIGDSFEKGGWGMRLILFAFLVSLWLIVDRLIMVYRSSAASYSFRQRILPQISSGDFNGAARTAKELDRPVGRIVERGLASASKGSVAVQRAIDSQAFYEVPQIEKRTGYLALMGNTATLMGLFGTIIGLIHSFGAVSEGSTSQNATLLAAGISEAMNCTAFGLLTGILALVAFSFLNGQTQKIIDDLQYTSLRVYRSIKQSLRVNAAANDIGSAAEHHSHPVHSPHAQLMSHIGLFTRDGSGGHGKKSTFANLQLTPLIDMFIVMVIFLLMSFSATGEIINANKNIKLPFAKSVEELERVPVVAVTFPENGAGSFGGGVVTLEGQEVATLDELAAMEDGDWEIVKLTEALEEAKQKWERTSGGRDFDGTLIVQSDQKVNFKVLKRIMYSAGKPGYINILFAVQKKE